MYGNVSLQQDGMKDKVQKFLVSEVHEPPPKVYEYEWRKRIWILNFCQALTSI